jgi:hypothetical protein
MYKDLISYELAEGKSESDLHQVAIKVYNDWMKNQKGFLGWEISKNSTGGYTDTVSWESKEHADLSNDNMANMPHSAEWMSCYKMETIKSVNLTKLFNF